LTGVNDRRTLSRWQINRICDWAVPVDIHPVAGLTHICQLYFQYREYTSYQQMDSLPI